MEISRIQLDHLIELNDSKLQDKLKKQLLEYSNIDLIDIPYQTKINIAEKDLENSTEYNIEISIKSDFFCRGHSGGEYLIQETIEINNKASFLNACKDSEFSLQGLSEEFNNLISNLNTIHNNKYPEYKFVNCKEMKSLKRKFNEIEKSTVEKQADISLSAYIDYEEYELEQWQRDQENLVLRDFFKELLNKTIPENISLYPERYSNGSIGGIIVSNEGDTYKVYMSDSPFSIRYSGFNQNDKIYSKKEIYMGSLNRVYDDIIKISKNKSLKKSLLKTFRSYDIKKQDQISVEKDFNNVKEDFYDVEIRLNLNKKEFNNLIKLLDNKKE